MSLEKCLDGEEICGNNMRWIYKKLVELIVSCELLSFLFATIVFNYSSKLHLIHLIVIFSLSKETKRFGFPLTNKGLIGCVDDLDDKFLKKYVLDNLFDIDNNFNNFSEPEIIVDFSNDSFGELFIDLKYNNSLSKERKKLESRNNPYSDNIMIIFLDSVSRVTSLKKLNKTLTFFEQFISYKGGFNEKYPEEKFHSFQFFKYITNYCSHLCQKDNSRTLHNATLSELYDHQMLICDPNAPRYHRPIRKCLYGKDDVGFLFDYSEQFWRKYKDNRKLSLLVIDSAHEETNEVIKYLDNVIFNYLYSLYNDNLFKDSSIFLLSDHGLGIQSIYFIFEFYKLEAELPMLYIIINDRKNIGYKEQYGYIQENQQAFITAYDIYNTINHLLYGDQYKYIINLTDEVPTPKTHLGNSLLEKIDTKSRKSKNYEFMNHNICI